MKLNRFFALAAIALLVVAAMGAITARAWAQGSSVPRVEDCAADQAEDVAEAESAEAEDGAEGEEAGDNDTGEAECDAPEGAEDGDAAPSGTAAITESEAQAIAEAHANAGNATVVELEEENGRLIYTVEFSDGSEVEVDANTAQVIGRGAVED